MRIALCLVFAAIVQGVPSSLAQDRQSRFQEISRLDDLVNEGEYQHAAQLAKLLLERLQIWGNDDQSVLVLAYIGKAQVELGRLGEAVKVLGEAGALASKVRNNLYEPALFRETAALQFALGQYDDAAGTAARAFRLSQEHNQDKILWGYCKSIEAMALLRAGKVSEAEMLSLSAVKEGPKKAGKYFVFAPRILYTACVVESHLEKYAAAEAYCRRGLEIAEQWKRETRDLSLGHLALAEAYLEAGDLTRSREAAAKSAEITVRLFGEQHQDMVQALGLLAQVSAKQGNTTEACSQANRAVKIGTAVFGAGYAGAAGPVRALRKMDACLPQAPR